MQAAQPEADGSNHSRLHVGTGAAVRPCEMWVSICVEGHKGHALLNYLHKSQLLFTGCAQNGAVLRVCLQPCIPATSRAVPLLSFLPSIAWCCNCSEGILNHMKDDCICIFNGLERELQNLLPICTIAYCSTVCCNCFIPCTI